MNPAKSLLQRGIAEQRKRIGEPECTIFDTVYPCMPSTLRKGTAVEWGGRIFQVQLTLLIDKDKLADLPKEPFTGMLVVYEGTEYKLVKQGISAMKSHFIFDLADWNA